MLKHLYCKPKMKVQSIDSEGIICSSNEYNTFKNNNRSMGVEVDNSSTYDVDMPKIMEQKNLFDGE